MVRFNWAYTFLLVSYESMTLMYRGRSYYYGNFKFNSIGVASPGGLMLTFFKCVAIITITNKHAATLI